MDAANAVENRDFASIIRRLIAFPRSVIQSRPAIWRVCAGRFSIFLRERTVSEPKLKVGIAAMLAVVRFGEVVPLLKDSIAC